MIFIACYWHRAGTRPHDFTHHKTGESVCERTANEQRRNPGRRGHVGKKFGFILARLSGEKNPCVIMRRHWKWESFFPAAALTLSRLSRMNVSTFSLSLPEGRHDVTWLFATGRLIYDAIVCMDKTPRTSFEGIGCTDVSFLSPWCTASYRA